ncbi:MAG: phage holin family protein [Mycobacteriales bacterium]|jgi:hypothetical protein
MSRDEHVKDLVSQLGDQLSRLVRDEIQLAKLEMAAKTKRLGVGAGLTGAAGLFAFWGGTALVAAGVAALALVLPAWAAALIGGAALLLVAGMCVLAGRRQMRRAGPPVPQEAIKSIEQDLRVVRERAS